MEWYGNEYILGGKNGHKPNCECPECTGEASMERAAQAYIEAWDRENIQW